MKSSHKAASSIGAVALILAGTATAAAPGLPGEKDPFGNGAIFDQWSVDNGTISADACTTNFSCGAALTDAGFFMRLVTDKNTGEMFYQTIVTEFDATAKKDELDEKLAFSDENFVSASNSSGILDKQRLTQNQGLFDTNTMTTIGNVRFENFTEIGTGWATDYVVLTQKIKEDLVSTPASLEDFQTDFIFYQDKYSTDPNKSVGMKITQYVPIAAGPGIIDRQDLVLVDLRGDYVAAAGSINIPDNGFNGQNQLGGGTVAWNAGDRIYGLWIGEDLSAVAGQQFGFVAYDKDPEVAGDRIQAFTLGDTWAEPNEHSSWDTALWGTLETVGTISVPFDHPLAP